MKMYTKPSLELNRFDVEDIIQTSTVGVYNDLSVDAKALYDSYATATSTDVSGKKVVEFEW